MKFVLQILFTIGILHAQTGHWEGVLQPPAGEIPIQVDIDTNSTGELQGSITTPELTGFPLSGMGAKGSEVFFQVKGTPGNRAFSGTLSSDNKTMSGAFKQGPFSLPFVLTRTGEARVAAASKLAALSKEMEGTWTGTADISGRTLQLVLNLVNQPDGSASGSLLSDDLEIPISSLKQTVSNVALELKAIGGTVSASLNGAELRGTFTQGATSFPVRFQRN